MRVLGFVSKAPPIVSGVLYMEVPFIIRCACSVFFQKRFFLLQDGVLYWSASSLPDKVGPEGPPGCENRVDFALTLDCFASEERDSPTAFVLEPGRDGWPTGAFVGARFGQPFTLDCRSEGPAGAAGRSEWLSGLRAHIAYGAQRRRAGHTPAAAAAAAATAAATAAARGDASAGRTLPASGVRPATAAASAPSAPSRGSSEKEGAPSAAASRCAACRDSGVDGKTLAACTCAAGLKAAARARVLAAASNEATAQQDAARRQSVLVRDATDAEVELGVFGGARGSTVLREEEAAEEIVCD